MAIRASQRIGSIFLAVILLCCTLPIQASADNSGLEGYYINEFNPLDDGLKLQTVAYGTSLSSLNLPTELDVSLSNGSEHTTGKVSGVIWQTENGYDPQIASTYIFEPIFESGISLGTSATLPQIVVEVALPDVIYTGNVTREIEVLKPALDPFSEPLETPIYGPAISNGSAKELWDILSSLDYGDDTSHAITFSDPTELSVQLDHNYSEAELAAAIDGIVNGYILQSVVTPATGAFWADFANKSWLANTLSLTLDYTIKNDLLSIDTAQFKFSYDLPMIFSDPPLSSIAEIVHNGGAPIYKDTWADVLTTVNAFGAAASVDQTIITLYQPVTVLVATEIPTVECTILGSSSDIVFTASQASSSPTLSPTKSIGFSNIILDGYNSTNHVPASINIKPASNTTLTLTGVKSSVGRALTVKNNAPANTNVSLILQNVSDLSQSTGMANVTVKSGTTNILDGLEATNSLVLEEGALIKIKYKLTNLKTIILPGPGAATIEFDGDSKVAFISYSGKASLEGVGDLNLTYANTTPAFIPSDPIIRYQTASGEFSPQELDRIKLKTPFDPLWTLKKSGDVGGFTNYQLYSSAVRVTYANGTKREEFETFAEAVAFVNGTTIPSGDNTVVMSIRNETTINGDLAAALPTRPVTIDSDIVIEGAPFKLISSSGNFYLNHNLILSNIIFEGPSSGPANVYLYDKAITTPRTLDIGTKVTFDKVTVLGANKPGANLIVSGVNGSDTKIVAGTGIYSATIKAGKKLVSIGAFSSDSLSVEGGATASAPSFTVANAINLDTTAILTSTAGAINSNTLTLGSGALTTASTNLAIINAINLDANATITATAGTISGSSLTLGNAAKATAGTNLTVTNAISLDASATITATAGTISGGSLTLGNAAKATAGTNITTPTATVGANAEVTATGGSVIVSGNLSTASGSKLKINNHISAGTLSGTDSGTISHTGGSSPAGGILQIGSGTPTGNFVISSTYTGWLANAVIVKLPQGIRLDDNLAITLDNTAFGRFALELDTTESDSSSDYYILKDVVASVTHSGTTTKYSTIQAAIAKINATSGASVANTKLNLWADATIDATTALPTRGCTISGKNGTSYPDSTVIHQITSSAASVPTSIKILADTKFEDIKLSFAGGIYANSGSGNTLTMGAGVDYLGNTSFVFEGTAGSSSQSQLVFSSPPNLTATHIKNFSYLETAANSKLNLGYISDISSIKFGSASEIKLGYIYNFNALVSDSTSKLVFKSALAGGNMTFPASFTGKLTITADTAYTPAYSDRLIARPDINSDDNTKLSSTELAKLVLGTGYDSPADNFSLKWKKGGVSDPNDYYILTQAVDNLDLVTVTNTSSFTYGDTITLKATLKSGGTIITDRYEDNMRVSFYLGTTLIGDAAVATDGTATLAITRSLYIVNASALNQSFEARFTDLGQITPVTKTIAILVNKKPVTVSAVGDTAINSAVIPSRVYDNTNTITYASGKNAANLLTLTATDILSGDIVLVSPSTLASFNTSDAEANKKIDISAITLTNTNYSPSVSTLGLVATTAEITKRQLTVSAVFSKVYDGNTTAILSGVATLGNIATGDTTANISLNAPTGFTYDNKNAATNKAITGSFAISGTKVGNYIAPLSTAITGLITPKTITIDPTTLADTNSFTKTFDGTNSYTNISGVSASLTNSSLAASDVGNISLTPLSVRYDTAAGDATGANAGNNKNITATFSLVSANSSSPIGNYTLAPTTVTKNVGVINKLTATIPTPPVIYVKINTNKTGAIDLGDLSYTTAINNTADDVKGYTIQNVSPSFFSANPSLSGATLNYTTNSFPLPEISASVHFDVKITSTNFADVTVPYSFQIVDKDHLIISGVAISGKEYDGLPITPPSSTPIFNDGGTVLTGVPYIYKYQGISGTSYPLSTIPPQNAGNYALNVEVDSDSSIYFGSLSVNFTITKRPLTITPKNKWVLQNAPLPSWSTFADFYSTGLVDGQSLEDADNLAASVPTINSAALDTSAAVNQTVLLDPIPTMKNYLLASGAGSLIISGQLIDHSWLVFNPSSPNENGWYNSDITAMPSPHANGYGFNQIAIWEGSTFELYPSYTMATQSAGGVSKDLFLATPTDQYTAPYSFNYKLDKTLPVLSNSLYNHVFNESSAIVTIDAFDSFSGVASVVAISPSGSSISMLKGAGNAYNAKVLESGLYTFYATDMAGNTISSTMNVQVKSLTGLEVKKDNIVVSEIYTNLNEGAFPLTADGTAGSTAAFGTDFDIVWTSTNPGVATIDQNGVVVPLSLGRTKITAFAMGVTRIINLTVNMEVPVIPTDPPTWPDTPTVVLPDGSVPDGVNRSDLILVIEILTLEEATDMEQAISNSRLPLVSPLYGNPAWKAQTQWMEIKLVDKANGYKEVALNGPMKIYLGYPPSSSQQKDYFGLLHKLGNRLEFVEIIANSNGLRFSVSSLSPFALTWLRDPGPDTDKGSGGVSFSGSSGGGGGGGSGGTYISPENFWPSVKDNIIKTEPGSTIKGDAPPVIDTCPSYILDSLAGKDLTLIITWAGDTIRINGKDIVKPPKDVKFYYLADLAKMFALSASNVPHGLMVIDLQNPSTGGDDLIIFGSDGAIRNSLNTKETPTVDAIPLTAEIISTPPVVAAASGGMVATHDNKGSLNILTSIIFIAIIVFAMIIAFFIRRKVKFGVVTSSLVLQPADPFLLAPSNSNDTNPITDYSAISTDSSTLIVTQAAECISESQSFESLIDGHKKLRQMLESGEITTQEYESKKHDLLFFS